MDGWMEGCMDTRMNDWMDGWCSKSRFKADHTKVGAIIGVISSSPSSLSSSSHHHLTTTLDGFVTQH